VKTFIEEVNVMFDLETMSSQANAAILSIGAVKFRFNGDPIVDEFVMNVDPLSCKGAGLRFDRETVEWWSKQSKEARDSWQKDPVPLKDALNAFSEWFGSKSLYTWSLGASFDQPILATAYHKTLNQSTPWKYFHGMCARTVLNMAGYDLKKEREASGNYHSALDDAKAQARAVMKVLGAEPF
jgi:hypothetical protein